MQPQQQPYYGGQPQAYPQGQPQAYPQAQPQAYPAPAYPGQPAAVVMQPVAMPTNTVTVIQKAPNPKPQNYMILAALTTIFCNCPLGMIAWIFSCLSDNSYDEGKIDEARSRGKVAMWLSIAGIILTVLLCIIVPIIVITSTAAAIDNAVNNGCTWRWDSSGNYRCY